MLIKDLLNLVFLEFENGHDMINFSEINRRCHQIFHKNIKVIHKLETETKYEQKYMKNNQDQKHGIRRGWRGNRQLKYEYNYIQGQLHGICIGWNKNGQFNSESNYYQGKYHGISRGWYSNGQLKYKTNYVRGQKKGISRGWYSNGVLGYEDHYN